MPFGKYKDFKDCVNKNQDRKNPQAYCAVIKRRIEDRKKNGESTDLSDEKLFTEGILDLMNTIEKKLE